MVKLESLLELEEEGHSPRTYLATDKNLSQISIPKLTIDFPLQLNPNKISSLYYSLTNNFLPIPYDKDMQQYYPVKQEIPSND